MFLPDFFLHAASSSPFIPPCHFSFQRIVFLHSYLQKISRVSISQTYPERRLKMAEEESISCARPTGGVVGESPHKEQPEPQHVQGAQTMIQPGKKAPDFSAPAFFNGTFTSVQLSDYLGKWVVLCFYPGDFTFV